MSPAPIWRVSSPAVTSNEPAMKSINCRAGAGWAASLQPAGTRIIRYSDATIGSDTSNGGAGGTKVRGANSTSRSSNRETPSASL